jgi:threonine 3-dehydrogenase
VFNENIGTYYNRKYGIDYRSIRYPGVISSEKYEFNGTTDYSTGNHSFFQTFFNLNIINIEIFFAALEKKYYKCWLGPKTDLPMIYIDDCIRGTVRLTFIY